MRVYAILIVFVSVFSGLYASNKTVEDVYANEILSSDLEKHLSVIASDELKGRNTGDAGQHLAGEYISNHFRKLDLEKIVNTPIGKSYYQKVDLVKARLKNLKLFANGNDFDFMQDFYCYSMYRDSAISIGSEFVGYGIESETINEYEGKDLEGKAAIILWAEPQLKNGNFLISGDENPSAWSGSYGWLKKSRIARKRGASDVIFLLPDTLMDKYLAEKRDYVFSEKLWLPDDIGQNKTSSWSAIFMSESNFSKLTGLVQNELNTYRKKILDKNIIDLICNTEITIQSEYETDEILTSNVLGFLKGRDSLAGTVVVTAHYDHVGYDDTGIYNGADDDGSGTVAVMEIAESFAKARDAGILPEKNILFMTVTGEEKGLLGSKYFTDYDPVIPLKDIVCNVNIDMVGRVDDDHKDNPEYVYSIGSGRLSSQLKALHEEVNKKTENLELNFEFDRLDDPNNFYKRSDHYNFAKNNIPVVFYFNGSHDDYHQTSDTVDKIRFDILEKRARLIYHTIREIANRPGRFEIDQTESESESE